MEKERLGLETILNISTKDKKCKECKDELTKINVSLQCKSNDFPIWKNEELLYCKNCNKYYISIFELDKYVKKYPEYMIYEKGRRKLKILSELVCYTISKNNKHLICEGKKKKPVFIKESVILIDDEGKCHYRKIRKCPNCNLYYINQDEAKEYRKLVKEFTMKAAKETKLLSSYKPKAIAGIPVNLNSYSKLNVIAENRCIDNHSIIEMCFKVGFMYNKKTMITKEMSGFYCKTCEMYMVTNEEYKLKSKGKTPICNIYINYDKKELNSNDIGKENKYIVSKKINNTYKADFFVRTNVIDCVNKNHNIVDVSAEIDVIDLNGNIKNKIIPAYYCENCNLYFIYNSDYENIRKEGVPLCQIYEYLKFMKGITYDIKLNQESLLHSFGYNVGLSDNLTDIQRRKILLLVIENGIIQKHKIISLLNYFIDTRKSNPSQINALKRWQSDIEYLKKINVKVKQHIKINSIKIARKINRENQ